ncbi:uncharacterized protein V6R79_012606 [Siganus canaliculatus]
MEPMDTTDTLWSWHYLADCGRWHRVEDDPDNPLCSAYVEENYKQNSNGVLKLFGSKLDFSAMLQTDLTTGKQRRMQRGYSMDKSCSCFSTCPVFWENVDLNCPYQLIPVSELTAEYQCVAHFVKNDGLLDKSIVSINRIQNFDLWELFCRKRKQLMRIHGVKHIEERRLFHGTSRRNVDSICKYNFDIRFAGQHGHMYGKGIYFAQHASYADKYSSTSTDPLPLYIGQTEALKGEPTSIIFLTRVIIGKSNVGQKDFRKPDDTSLENTHHSCVDDINNPKIFVIFDPNQLYPEYLVQYK